MNIDLAAKLKNPPWTLFQRNCHDVDELLKEATTRLGTPVAVSKLRPYKASEARVNSLSSRYGLGNFPLHTDFSTYPRPPRYILFLARSPRRTGTLICDAQKIADEFKVAELLSSVFVIHKNFPQYCRIIEGRDPNRFYRFNADVMAPKNACAHRISKFISHDLIPDVSIDWMENCGALVFNWQALHGRGVVNASDGEQLERYAFY